MSVPAIFEPERLDLADLISALLDKGVVLRGEADISVADIDLVHLDLGVLLVAAETAIRQRKRGASLAATMGPAVLTTERAAIAGRSDVTSSGNAEAGVPTAAGGAVAADVQEVSLREVAPALPGRANVDPDGIENGLARLALTLIEALRKVLEHQAIRRMEGGSLSEQEIERLGLGLLRLHDQMQELKAVFGLTDDDLQIDLGPLGRVR